ncbi:MAG: pilin [Acidimicrobiales bacterium]
MPSPRPSSLTRPSQVSRSQRLARLSRRVAAVALPAAAVAAVLLVAVAPPAFAATGGAATSLNSVIDNLRNWLVGILAAVATLFLTVGGLRYLTAGGDPGQVEKAKTALKSAAIGYALAALAPLLVSILASLF